MTAPNAPQAGLDAHLVVARSAEFRLDLELAIAPGETVALLGPNGAGKTTAVSVLAGLVVLDEGHVRLSSRALDDPGEGVFVRAERRNVGVVFQDQVLFPHLTAAENIAYGPRTRGATKRDAIRLALDWLQRLDLAGLAGRRPDELSGGEAQRVALARALAIDPDLLLLDEPLASLDVTTRAALRRTLADHLRGFRGPRLLITHDPVDAFLLADRVVVVEDGVATHGGTPDDIRRHPRTLYTADLAGVNLVVGVVSGGVVRLAQDPPMHIADSSLAGEVLLTIHPRSISLHRDRPGGSPRNTWMTTISVVEPLGDRTRIQLGPPHRLTAEITSAAHADLGLRRGDTIWVALKATEIGVEPA